MEQEGMMYFVNPEDVMRLFKDYVEIYNGLISKEIAYEELENALDSAEGMWIKKEASDESKNR